MKYAPLTSDLYILLNILNQNDGNVCFRDKRELITLDDKRIFNEEGKEEDASRVLISTDPLTTSDAQYDFILSFNRQKITLPGFKATRLKLITRKNGRIQWMFPSESLKFVPSLYATTTFKAAARAKILKVADALGAGMLVPQKTLTIYSKEELVFERLVKHVKGTSFVCSLGTPSFDQKAVVAINNGYMSTHFAKIAMDQRGKLFIQNEKRFVKLVDRLKLRSLTVPQVEDCDDVMISLQTNVGDKQLKQSLELGRTHYKFLHELLERTKLTRKVHDLEYWDRILNSCYSIVQHKTLPEVQTLNHLVVSLKQAIDTNQEILCGLSHGDFTPWNFKVSEQQLFVYDWERALYSAPALYDLFHFHFQTGIFHGNLTFKEIYTNIQKSLEDSRMQRIMKRYEIDLSLHMKLYLLRIVSFTLAGINKVGAITDDQDKMIRVWKEALFYFNAQNGISNQREYFLKDFDSNLKRTPHAYLKLEVNEITKLPMKSDLDIAVIKQDIPAIVTFCKEHEFVMKTRLVRKSFMTVVQLFFKDGSFLSIDLVNQFKRRARVYMPTEPLIISALHSYSGPNVPDKRFDLEYALLFYTLNGAQIPKKYEVLFGKTDYSARERAMRYLKNKYKLSIETFGELFDLSAYNISQIKRNVKARQGRISMRNVVSYMLDTVKSATLQRGFIVTINGVDGAGKTTIINMVKDQLAMKYRKEVVLLRHRPGILPILSSFVYGNKQKAEQIAAVTQPRQGTNKSKISSTLRFGYYYMDYLFGQIYVYTRYILRGKIVVYDRYYFDFIVDGKRSNIEMDNRMIRKLYFLIMKPRLNILLWAKANVILDRKQELDETAIRTLTRDYKKLFSRYNKRYANSTYKTIENTDTEQTVNSILSEFGKVA